MTEGMTKVTNPTPEAVRMAELLPCPFCGSAEHLFVEPEETGSGGQWVSPIHAGCSARTGCGVSRIGDDEAEAITAWNSRAALERPHSKEQGK